MGRVMSEVGPVDHKATIRVRIMWTMILLTLVTLAAAGAIVALVQDRRISDDIHHQLEIIHGELRVLSSEGVDPETGERFAGPERLLKTYLARTVVSPAEGELGFIGDQVALVASEDVMLRPENDRELIALVTPWVRAESVRIEPVRTEQGNYHVLLAPVEGADGTRGALLHVFDRDVAEGELRRTMTLYAAVALVMMGAVILVAWGLVGRLLKPIEELRRAADAISERDLTTRVPLRGNDDLTALSATINRMLDRVQLTVEGQRQLLDDIGHELRTPITVVRGHLELIDPTDPADVRATRDLAIDELDRMNGLVGDLILLAKSIESDFVQPQWIDLAMLTDDVFEKSKALGERRWLLERVATSEAWIDSGRITQAWLQLAANAVKYSAPGSSIWIGSRLHRGTVELWVRDQGIGIADGELQRVRERFARTSEAMSFTQGAGLGLSIVESIVEAHGGSLVIDSTPGVGSTFTMSLPIAPSRESSA